MTEKKTGQDAPELKTADPRPIPVVRQPGRRKPAVPPDVPSSSAEAADSPFPVAAASVAAASVAAASVAAKPSVVDLDGSSLPEDRRRRALGISVWDGSFDAVKLGFGQNYFGAYGVFLGASSLLLGLLGSLPHALGAASQLLTDTLLRRFRSRKRLVITMVTFEALLYLPIAFAFLYGEPKAWLLLLLVSLNLLFGVIASPAWGSWMGDLVASRERGNYFGRRNQVTGFALFLSFLVAGMILQRFGDAGAEGFLIIFLIAFAAKAISILLLAKQDEPPFSPDETPRISLFTFLHEAQRTNSGRLVLYLAAMNFAVYLAAPLFSAYMLLSLGYDWIIFTVVTGASMLVKYLAMPLWGGASDRYGTRKTLVLASLLVSLVPFFWLFRTELWYLLLVQAFSGFVWAGYELASFNYLLDVTTPKTRATFLAFNNVVNGVAILLGGLLGGLLAKSNAAFWSPFLLVFLVSGLVRYLVVALFSPRLREVREVEHITYEELLFRLAAVGPTMGLVQSVMSSTHAMAHATTLVVRTVKDEFYAVEDHMERLGDLTRRLFGGKKDL